MRRLASRSDARELRLGGLAASRRSPSKASAAIAEATSPALAPPMPSATAKKGGAHHERVLVRAALAADVGPARLLDDPQGHRRYSW